MRVWQGIRFPSLPLQENGGKTSLAPFFSGKVRCYNPWPELVNLSDPDDLRRGWSNPFVRLLYLPTSQPERLPTGSQGQSPLSLWVGALHEHLHLALDYTPAKELVRACLGMAYHQISELMDAPSDEWNKRSAGCWSALCALNNSADEMVGRIRLAEELLVTATSFRAIQNQLTAVDEIDTLKALEIRWVKSAGENFERLYYGAATEGKPGGFKKLSRLISSRESPLPSVMAFGRCGVFLESVDTEGRRDPFCLFDRVSDSRKRCEELVDAIYYIENERHLAAWLDRGGKADIVGWKIALGVVAGLSREYPPVKALWELARGRKLQRRRFDFLKKNASHANQIAAEVQREYWKWPSPSIDWARVNWTQVLLYPRERGGIWYITPLPTQGQGIDGDYGALLATESFRQQLSAGRGILCPYFVVGGGCSCDPEFRRMVNRLARWALEGRLGGRREFEKLSPPCGGGN